MGRGCKYLVNSARTVVIFHVENIKTKNMNSKTDIFQKKIYICGMSLWLEGKERIFMAKNRNYKGKDR